MRSDGLVHALRRRLAIGVIAVLAVAIAVVAATTRTPALAPEPRIVNGVKTQDYPTTGVLLHGAHCDLDTSVPCREDQDCVDAMAGTTCVPDGINARGGCTGTLIGCETFLTAAHCVHNDTDVTHYTVFLQHAGFFEVTNIAEHPMYNPPAPASELADIAVLKIQGKNPPTPAGPVTSIFPSPLDTVADGECVDGTNDGTACTDDNDCTDDGTCAHHLGAKGVIAGFGTIGNASENFGLKRRGTVDIVSCDAAKNDPVGDPAINHSDNICWDFPNGGPPVGPPGTDSNTCYGDSGGPLFIGNGCADPVAGVTTAGTNSFCFTTDHAWDARVANFLPFIQAEGGADLDNTMCGTSSHVEDGNTIVYKFDGFLTAANPQANHQFAVPLGATELRVALNGRDGVLGKCMNGTNDWTDCALDSQCTGGGKCAFRLCANGTNNGTICDHPSQCTGGGTCERFCVNGTNDGTECTSDLDCTGGGVCNDSPETDFNLYLRRGGPASPAQFDCKGDGPNAYEYCQKDTPIADTWHVNVRRATHDGEYQLTVTVIFPMKLKHFRCWRTRGPFIPVPNVSLTDQFGSLLVDVKKPRRLCAPASKNSEDCRAPTDPDHLTFYRIKSHTPFTPVRNQVVQDQFSLANPLRLDVLRPVGLLVPTAKSLTGPPGSPAGPLLDHFTCYRVRRSRGAPRFTPIRGVTFEDQFGTRVVDLIRPSRLCAPTNKNGEDPDAPNHTGHLLCYLTRAQPRRVPLPPVYLLNQFGQQQYRLGNKNETCLPVLKNPPAGSP